MGARAVSLAEETAAASPPRESALARIAGVFFSPFTTFDSIARRPTYLAPLLLWTAASLVVTALIVPRLDFERAIRQAIEERGRNVPEERIEAMVESQKRLGPIFGYGWGALAPTVITLLLAAIFLGCFKAFGWDMRFRQAFGVTAHAFLPGAFSYVLAIPVILQREKLNPALMGSLVKSNLGFLVEKDSAPAIHSLLSSLDIFSFWVLALLVVGFAAAANVSRKQSAAVIVTLWLLFVLIKTGWAAWSA